MHDIDRTQMEYSPELSSFEGEYDEFAEQEWSGEDEGEGEGYGETYGETVLNEADETELASELLEVTNEAELDQFLGKLLRRAARVRRLGRALADRASGRRCAQGRGEEGPAAGRRRARRRRSVARSAPRSAAAWPRPPAAPSASKAKRWNRKTASSKARSTFVRLGADTVKQAAATPPGADPRAAAQNAAIAAASKHAPGLLGGAAGATRPGAMFAPGRGRGGRWLRRGTKIVLYGV